MMRRLVCAAAILWTTASATAQTVAPPADARQPPALGLPGRTTLPPTIAAPATSAPPASASAAAPPAGTTATATRDTVPVTARQTAAAELVAALLEPPDGAKLEGRWVGLADVLSAVPDRGRRASACRAYWALTAALADYNGAADELRTFEQLGPIIAQGREQAALLGLETRLESAKAQRRDAEATLSARQAELAGLMGSTSAVLPADPPHVGRYDTKFDLIFAGRTAPASLQLLNRALPWRQESINAHAKALQAAYDAADAALDSYRQRLIDWIVLADCYDRLAAQRRAFVAAVTRYNQDIAEYAMAVAPDGMAGVQLTALLVMPRAGNASAIAATEQGGSGVAPARFDQPVGNRPVGNQPTLAPGRTGATPAATTPRDAIPSAADLFGRYDQLPAGTTTASGPQRANRPIEDVPGLYGALVDMSPARRAQELVEALHWDRELPDADGRPLTLADALAGSSNAARTLATYWQARECAARYQALAQRVALLNDMAPAVLAARGQPGGAEAMLRLRQARLAADAALVDARIDWMGQLAALAALTPATESNGAAGAWPVPTTPPHGGGYRVVASNDAVRSRNAQAVQTMHAAVEHQAKALVLVDFERARLTSALVAGTLGIDEALAAIERQTEATLLLLELVTRYNNAIGDYALTTLSPNLPARQLAAALVLPRN